MTLKTIYKSTSWNENRNQSESPGRSRYRKPEYKEEGDWATEEINILTVISGDKLINSFQCEFLTIVRESLYLHIDI